MKIPVPIPSFAKLLKRPGAQESLSQKSAFVGLDIGRSSLSVVQLTKAGQDIILEKFASASVQHDAPLASQIKQILAKAQITEKKVHASIKGQGVILRFITFPRMSPEDFSSAVQYEAEKYIPFAMSEVMLDFYIVDDGSTGASPAKNMEVVLAAARKQEVMRAVKLLQEAELQPISIDVDAIALTNAFTFSHKQEAEKTLVLIDFGTKDTNINVVEKGGLRFSRDITFGGQDITSFLMKKLGTNDQEAYAIQSAASFKDPAHADLVRQSCASVIQEIKVSLNYFQSQHQEAEAPSTIYVSGGVSKISVFREVLEKETGLKVLEWDAIEQLKLGPEVNAQELGQFKAYLPVSIGLALRGCE